MKRHTNVADSVQLRNFHYPRGRNIEAAHCYNHQKVSCLYLFYGVTVMKVMPSVSMGEVVGNGPPLLMNCLAFIMKLNPKFKLN